MAIQSQTLQKSVNRHSHSSLDVDYENIEVGENFKKCPRCLGLYVFAPVTGEIYNVSCNTYACEVCGTRKKRKLEKGLTEYLKGWKHIRLFTFTVKTSLFGSRAKAPSKLSAIWRYFMTALRRNQQLSEKQRQVQFVRVVEFHKSGFPHLHVLMSEYLPWIIVQSLWNLAVASILKSFGKSGHCNIRHSFQAEGGARYVAKYVWKTANDLKTMDLRKDDGTSFKMRLWSKSSKVKIFISKVGEYRFFFVDSKKSPLNLSLVRISSQLTVSDFIQIMSPT